MYLSDLKAEVESRGRTFTPELYDKALAKFGKKLVVDAWRPGAAPAVPDTNDPVVLAQEKRMQDEGAEGQLDIPLPDRMVNSLARGLTFGVVDPMEPPRMESSGVGALDRTASDALIGASDLAGMIGASAILPGAGLAGKAGRLAKMGEGAASLGQYGMIRGAVETGFQDPGEVVKRGLKDALLGGLLPLAPHGAGVVGKAASQFGIGAGLAGADQAMSGEFDPSSIASSGLALALAGGLTGIPEARAERASRRPGQRKPAEEKRPGVKKDNILAAALLPAEVQIARQSPEARKVAEMLHAGKYEPKRSGGPFARSLVEHRSSSMNQEESASIGQAIQGFKDPETLTPKARKLMDVTRDYLREVAVKFSAEDAKLYTVSGKRVPFPGPNENYFPRISVKTEDLKVGGKARDRVIKNAVAIRAFETEAEAGEMLNSYIDIAENGMHARNKKMADRLMQSGKANSVQEAVALIEGNRRNDGPERFGSLEYAREFDNPFYEPDFNKAMTQYSREAERRIAETREWGQDNERLKESIAQIQDRSERKGVELTAETAKGIVKELSKPIDDAAIVMRRFGSYMMSPLSAIRNTGQSDNSLLLTDFKSVIKAINLSREARLRAIESGATSGPVLHDVEMGKGGAPSYQKIILQTGTEVLLRTHANNAGMNYFHDYVDRIRKTPGNKFVAHELRKMGFNDADIADLGTGRELTREDYNKAGFNIAARGQFIYDELDVPAWFNSTQPGKTASQFKPWIVQQSHLIYDETVGQWKGGTREGKFRACRNVALLATLYPLRGEVLNDIVALIQGKKRESNLFKRYLEDAAQMGVLTVVSDLYNAVQYDNAEGLMMGASVSKARDMATIAGRLAKNQTLSYSDQRLLFRMTPIIGPLFAYRMFPKLNEEGAESEGPKGRPGRVRPGSSRPGTRRPGRTRPARN
jgi:hypothetical protein